MTPTVLHATRTTRALALLDAAAAALRAQPPVADDAWGRAGDAGRVLAAAEMVAWVAGVEGAEEPR